MKYRVIKPYRTQCYIFPLVIPVGAILTWFEHGRCFTAPSQNFGDGINIVPYVGQYAVEAWTDYFEAIK